METMPKDLLNKDNPLNMDLVLEGGAFNGSYLVGILFFLQEMEKKGMIRTCRISTCSVSTIAGILYIIGRLDLFEDIYSRGLEMFKCNGRFEILTDIFKLILDITGDNLYKNLNKRLFITYYDLKYCKQVVKCRYKSNNDVFECISRSTHIPFIIDKHIARHGRYIDGQQPYFFKDRTDRKTLCISLVNYMYNVGTVMSTITVKNETNNIHRVIGGTLDVHSFFMTGMPSNMCCFKDQMPLIIKFQNKFKQIFMVAFGYFIYIILYMKKNMGTNLLSSFAVKALYVIIEDLYRLFILHYCV